MAVERPDSGENPATDEGSAWYGLAGAFALGVLAVVAQAVLLRKGLSAAALA